MNDNIITLRDICVGEKYRVKKLSAQGTMRRRLIDIGMIEGTPVECVLRSPGGDPTAFLIRGAVIALRNEDSSEVIIEL